MESGGRQDAGLMASRIGHGMNHETQNPPAERQTYVRPALTEIGHVAVKTLGSSGPMLDATTPADAPLPL